MNLVPADFGGQFGRRNEFNRCGMTGGGHASATLHRIMIGQRHRFQIVLLGQRGQLLRGVSAIGEVGVEMEVGNHEIQ